MIYTIICALFAAGFIFLTILESKCSDPIRFKRLHIADCAAVCIGIAGIVITVVIFNIHVGGFDFSEEFSGWAGDLFRLFVKMSLAMCVFMLLMTSVSGLLNIAEKKGQKGYSGFIRYFVPVLCCIMLMLFTLICTHIADNEIMHIDNYIVSLGIFESMTLRLMYAIDGFAKRKRLNSKNQPN